MLTLGRPPLRDEVLGTDEKTFSPVVARWLDALWRKLGQAGSVPIESGGTGAETAAAARASLGAAASGVNSDITELTLGAGIRILAGSGDPEGVVTASQGSLYLRTDIGAAVVLYIKESGDETVGWVAK